MSRLMEHQIDGRDFTIEELVDYGLLLFIAGLDTVANSLVFGMRHLAGDPALQQRLRADPSRIPDAVEELLRRYGVVTVMRLVTRDADFGGVRLKGGDRVMLMLAAANLDPNSFPDPASFDLDRENKVHVTFNAGPHRCVGSHLARLELRVFYEEWFRRMPDVRLDPDGRPAFRAGLTLALDRLPLLWDPQSSNSL
ncbi:MAG: cytochrome P450 [Sphingomonadales bacterium]|nr:MAG: cytochrome P450 [Sphingomonadales bacterium]